MATGYFFFPWLGVCVGTERWVVTAGDGGVDAALSGVGEVPGAAVLRPADCCGEGSGPPAARGPGV